MNPIKIEYTGVSGQIFNEQDTIFLLNLNRNIVGFTGNYKKEDDMFSLETFIYKAPNFYTGENLECDSKTFLQNHPNKVIDLLTILHNEFWYKGWVHGDLDSSNIVIQHKDNNIFFRIFDFEHIEFNVPTDSIGFFKFIWSDIRKFMKEYLDLELVKNMKTNKCYWLYEQTKLFNSYKNVEETLCDIIVRSQDDCVDFRRTILVTLEFLASFSVYKQEYTFTTPDNKELKVVYDNMILSGDDDSE
jgi:hypothetical protein